METITYQNRSLAGFRKFVEEVLSAKEGKEG